MRPGIFTPLKTRAGSALAPIEPGARTLCEPWVTGPRLKLWRLIVPWKPLPIAIAGDLDLLAGLELLDRELLADLRLRRLVAELDQRSATAARRPSSGGRARPW